MQKLCVKRSTKAGILSRRHRACGLRTLTSLTTLNEGRDTIPATPCRRAPAICPKPPAQRRPGYYPGDTQRESERRRALIGRSTKAGILSRRHPGSPWRPASRPASLNEGRDTIPATPAQGGLDGAKHLDRSTKAGILSRRHPPSPACCRSAQHPLNEGRDTIPATPVSSPTNASPTVSAQRRPGYYPGDTSHVLVCVGKCNGAQRRPGYYPGDTPYSAGN